MDPGEKEVKVGRQGWLSYLEGKLQIFKEINFCGVHSVYHDDYNTNCGI